MTSSASKRTIPGEAYVGMAGLAAVLLVVLRQPAGPVIAPVIVQGQGHQVRQTASESPEGAVVRPVHAPGDVCLETGVFRPVGELRRGRKAVRPRAFRAGEVFPGLPGYVTGSVWMRE